MALLKYYLDSKLHIDWMRNMSRVVDVIKIYDYPKCMPQTIKGIVQQQYAAVSSDDRGAPLPLFGVKR